MCTGIALVRAQPLDLAVLQHVQEFHLRRKRQVADFVEEDRAAVGQFELAHARLLGVGKSAAFVAEEFAFQQRFRQRRAVHLDERLAVPARLQSAAPAPPAPCPFRFRRESARWNRLRDTSRIRSNTRCMAAERPTRPPSLWSPPSRRFNFSTSLANRKLDSADSSAAASNRASRGCVTTCVAPVRIAATISSRCPLLRIDHHRQRLAALAHAIQKVQTRCPRQLHIA